MVDENDGHVSREQRRVTPSNMSNWKVLIIDDQMDNLLIAEAALQFHNAETRTATNGVEGLKVMQDYNPTLILLDLSMPEMNGWEMFIKVRSNPNWRTIPVIALTAHAMQGDRERVLEAGFTGYIPKPFSVATLVPDIKRILRTEE